VPKDKGPEWKYAIMAELEGDEKFPKNECKLCPHKFFRSATRIRQHSLRVPGRGVAKCGAAAELG